MPGAIRISFRVSPRELGLLSPTKNSWTKRHA